MDDPPTVTRQVSSISTPLCSDSPSVNERRSSGDLPNLTLFVGEVASQHREQREVLEDLQDVLNQNLAEAEELKQVYRQLSSERLSWEQKIVLNKDHSAQHKKEIIRLKNQVAEKLKVKYALEEQGSRLDKEISSCESEIELHSAKMSKHVEKIQQIESQNEDCVAIHATMKEIDLLKERLNTAQKTGAKSTGEKDILRDVANLNSEKKRLEGILKNKTKTLQDENEKIAIKLQEKDITRKKLRAQKLRLRGMITKAENSRQQLRREADAIRKQIETIAGRGY